MILHIIRHGLAKKRSPRRKDEDRALTKKGKRWTRQAMRGLVALGARPRLILSSPLVRARQTAEILGRALGKKKPRFEKALAPGGNARDLLARLANESVDEVALVGHEPDLSLLVKLLTGGAIELAKAGCARVDGEPARRKGKLVWAATPLLLRRLGR